MLTLRQGMRSNDDTGFGSLIVLVGLLVLGAVGASSCSDSTDNRPLEATSAELRSDHHAELAVLLEIELPELMERVALIRARESTIEAALEEDSGLHRPDQLRVLYGQRGHKPVWIEIDQGSARLRPGATGVVGLLKKGVSQHGLWPGEMHLDRLDAADFDQSEANTRPFEHVELGEERRRRVLAWLEEERYELSGPGGMVDLVDRLTDPGAPLRGLDEAVDDYAGQVSHRRKEAVAFELALSDAAMEFAAQMRLNNPAWHSDYTFPAHLSSERDAEHSDEQPGERPEALASELAAEAPRGEALEIARREHLVGEVFEKLASDTDRAPEVLAEMVPPYEDYRRLTEAFSRYSRIVEEGGWPELSPQTEGLSVGATGPEVARLQERLRIEGYYEGEANGVFDQDLERALVDYQQTHQLWEADEVTAQTLRSLDIPAEHRWHQIRATLDRWRESRVGSDDHYIHVNIPDFYASIWRDGERKKRLKLIVGDTDKKRERGEVVYKNATPRFSEMMRYVVFNPYWNIPKRIRDKEVEPRFERELEELKEKDEEAEDLTLEEYVERKGYEYFTDDDGRERLRQKPGESNALGRVKFLFPNAHAVYMHDTPQKALFDRPFRAFSHGCIRLEEPMELAEYLLDVDGRWGEPEARKKRVDKWLERDDDVWVQLDDPLPVHIEYYVVRADAQGRAHFFSDLYDLDEKRLEQIAERVEELDSLGSQTARAD